jgi:hypothetical protein
MAGERAAKRAAVLLLAATAAALVFVATAVAAENYTFRFTAADQAAARATVLHRADLGNTVWKGGLTKADLSPPPGCMGRLKLSDLVVTGAAESSYTGSGIWFDNEVELLRTPRMVTVDWQRLMHTSNFLSCYRSVAAKARPRIGKVGSIRWIAFPQVATHVRALRLIIDVPVSGTSVSYIYDSVLIGSGRAEITLTTLSPYAARAAVFAAEQRLARILVKRCPN